MSFPLFKSFKLLVAAKSQDPTRISPQQDHNIDKIDCKPGLKTRFKARFKSLQKQLWINRSFRTKLFILLAGGVSLPVALTTAAIVGVAEQYLLENLQASLQKDLLNLKTQLHYVEAVTQDIAASLETNLELAAIDLSQSQLTASQQQYVDRLVKTLPKTSQSASFYLVTDPQGKTIAHNIQILAEDFQSYPGLPLQGQLPPAPRYRPVAVPTGIDLSQVGMVQDALRLRRSLQGVQLVRSSVLQPMGLAPQARIGWRTQNLQGVPLPKQPFPEGTFDTEQGQIGLTVMAVHPIEVNQRMVGMVIVGTLLNRNHQIVDTVQYNSGVSTATIFAQDWRISTNVPHASTQTRAIGTRLAREVADKVLHQQQTFMGRATIVGQDYLTIYEPLYDHRYQLDQQRATPVGVLYVGERKASVDQIVQRMERTGYALAIVIGLGGVVVVLPIANGFSRSLSRLTQFAQQIGSGERRTRAMGESSGVPAGAQISAIDWYELGERQDELGILTQELLLMSDRIEAHLAQVMDSEGQIRQQAAQLATALTDLRQAQSQLIQSAKMSSLEQLVAGVAHEINNPVNFIYGNLNYATDYFAELLELVRLYEQIYRQDDRLIDVQSDTRKYSQANPQANLRDDSQDDSQDDLQDHSRNGSKTRLSPEAIEAAIVAIDVEFIAADLPNLLSSMQHGAERIRSIVQSLRIFSRLDESAYKSVDIHAGLDSTLHLLQHRLHASATRPAIQVDKAYGQLPPVECFAAELNQVFLQIISNAIDAIEEVSLWAVTPKIHIQTEATAEQIKIGIRNNGNPIDPTIQARLFDPFFTTKPVGKGVGLGLAISHQIIVNQHQGRIACSSDPIAGTEFTIEIPMWQNVSGTNLQPHQAESETIYAAS